MNYPTDLPAEKDETESKWGYAVAGAIALGFAALIQFAFDPPPDALEGLHPIVAVPYEVAGKLGLTIPLAAIGLGLIARDVLANRGAPAPAPAPPKTAAVLRKAFKPKRAEEAAETEEPLAEEIDEGTDEPKGAAKKIPALGRPFAARAGGHAKGPADGQVVLASAKYMNTGKPKFNKGKKGFRDE